jgi:hypothetical protein
MRDLVLCALISMLARALDYSTVQHSAACFSFNARVGFIRKTRWLFLFECCLSSTASFLQLSPPHLFLFRLHPAFPFCQDAIKWELRVLKLRGRPVALPDIYRPTLVKEEDAGMDMLILMKRIREDGVRAHISCFCEVTIG